MLSQTGTDHDQRIVTRQDVAGALISLSTLPKRVALDAKIELESYVVALKGVTAGALVGAVTRSLQGGFGHAWFPNPAELRIACSEAMEAERRTAAKARQEELNGREFEEHARVLASRTDEERQRVAARYRAFHEELRPAGEADELAAIRAKYPADVLDSIPDRPRGRLSGTAFEQVGR